MRTLPIVRRLIVSAAFAGTTLGAQAADFTVAYQTSVSPAVVAQADGAYEKATHSQIDWRRFDDGASVVAALASGSVQFGYLGSSPDAAAASRKVPIETFLIAAKLINSEALVTRDGAGIAKPADLIGKKIATPFVSTSHYSLLAALKHWHIDPSQVQILNLNPPAISAAWRRGDIDAAYVWDPALGVTKETGKVLVTSGEVGRFGSPTFDVWVVRKDFAEQHPDIVKAFAATTLHAYADYERNPKAWLADPAHIDAVARITGAQKSDIPGLLEGNDFPTLAQQRGTLGTPTVSALSNTSRFLKDQGKIDDVLADYTPYVSTRYLPTGQ
ncbi:taurine ABC transporter substrate-binding protein [Trinickia acidisoli]|uniref:taurine ABC transporter substrate-binding protein n=1 Tax=Trinickia acidisoli TaxID=2767482 RepID=UPI001A8D932F|nr:taurine ABC transporter substrate-binding protein [Trinickia acidisoli]